MQEKQEKMLVIRIQKQNKNKKKQKTNNIIISRNIIITIKIKCNKRSSSYLSCVKGGDYIRKNKHYYRIRRNHNDNDKYL